MVISSHGSIGYRTAHYLVTGTRTRGVRLRFVSAESTIDGHSTPETQSPSLPFRLPPRTMHVRLVYLIRASVADHDMAILAAKNIEQLDAFTEEFRRNPAICGERAKIFCSLTPAGIAVGPEP